MSYDLQQADKHLDAISKQNVPVRDGKAAKFPRSPTVLDLDKLTPAPWGENGRGSVFAVDEKGDTRNRGQRPCGDLFPIISRNSGSTDATFIALARNAFDGDPEALAWWEANRVKVEAQPVSP